MRLEEAGNLKQFISLKEKNTNWDVEKRLVEVKDENLPIVFIRAKKEKYMYVHYDT